jgi:hypothetical protein
MAMASAALAARSETNDRMTGSLKYLAEPAAIPLSGRWSPKTGLRFDHQSFLF